jgi:Leucine-rich repeat (LRR) protein
MDNASKDVLFTIAQNLDLLDLLRWCSTNSKIYRCVCNNDNVWRSKLLIDYNDYEKFNLKKSLKETYIFLYQLTYIKKLLKTNESIYDIFLKKKIILSDKELKKVPEFDLPNLEILDLSGNRLKTVPMFNLPMLKDLKLFDNQLTELPNFQLPNLESLNLHNNRLRTIPSFNLPKLKYLSLYNNLLTKIPELIIPKLREIYLYDNKLSPNELRNVFATFSNKVRKN